MNWQKAQPHSTTEGPWWFLNEPDLVIKLFIPKGKKMWIATVNGNRVVNEESWEYAPKRWSVVEIAKKALLESYGPTA